MPLYEHVMIARQDLSNAQAEGLIEHFGTTREAMGERVAFIGDSPNDAPMFGSFPCSIGVANLERFFDVLDAYPRWMTQLPGGLGFRELADRLLAARN